MAVEREVGGYLFDKLQAAGRNVRVDTRWGAADPELFKKIVTQARVEALQKAMDGVLSEGAGIRDKKWWIHEEFNNPRT